MSDEENIQERITTKKIEVEKAKLELARLQGKYGLCKKCGNEGEFYDWDGSCVCRACANKELKTKYRTKFEYLIGKKIIDIDVETISGNLDSIKLDDGTVIEVEYGHNDCYLSIK